MPVLPLKRTAFHTPESDIPRDFETPGTWGGAGFLLGAYIKYCAYLGTGVGPRREETKRQPRRLCL